MGKNHHVFVRGLHEINRRRDKAHPYTNYIPIMQSSGTGKSRLVHETAGLIFTLPFNIRGDMDVKGILCGESVVELVI